MAERSGISWTDSTYNPWVGCTKIGPGCDNCYAETWDRRAGGVSHWGPHAPRRRTTEHNRNAPRRWQRNARGFHALHGRRRRVFVASLADVFDNAVPDEWRADLWRLIAACPDLEWIVVTKRVGNVHTMSPAGGFPPNVILLATVVNQAEANRDVSKLIALKTCAYVHYIGLSIEPMLGPIDLEWPRAGAEPLYLPWLTDIDWVIVGGESGPGARPMHVAWPRSLRDQCKRWRVPYFFKQWGPPRAAGHLLDDTEHHAFPVLS